MDPLAQLQDIQLPEKINNYPIAIGWWIVAVICIALIIFISVKVINYKKARRLQKQAIEKINASENMKVAECITLLKWAALQYFPRENVANLYGESFYNFLVTSLPENRQDKFKTLSGNTLQTVYQKTPTNIDNKSFQQATSFWLKHALPPKSKELVPHSLMEAK